MSDIRAWSTRDVRLVLEVLDELAIERRDVLAERAVLRRELERRQEEAERLIVRPVPRQEVSER